MSEIKGVTPTNEANGDSHDRAKLLIKKFFHAFMPDARTSYKKKGLIHSYEWTNLPKSYLESVIQPVISKLSKDALIVDIGSGKGEVAEYLVQQNFPSTISLDYNSAGLQLQKDMNPEAMSAQAEATTLPFANESVDFIHCKDLLVHIEDKSAFFNELARVLKPGGKYIITTNTTNDMMPGYFTTEKAQVLNDLMNSGLHIQRETKFTPKISEMGRDWYSYGSLIADKRFVIIGNKPTDSEDTLS